MKDLIKKSEDLAYGEVSSTGMPLKQHIDLSRSNAIAFAEQLDARIEVTLDNGGEQ